MPFIIVNTTKYNTIFIVSLNSIEFPICFIFIKHIAVTTAYIIPNNINLIISV